MNKKYVLVPWPQSQIFMEHLSFNDCYLLQATDKQTHYDAAYFVPEELFKAVTGKEEIDDLLSFLKNQT